MIGKAVFSLSKKEQKSYIAGSSGETVGRDKVTNNYFSFPRVGNPDDLFNKKDAEEKVIDYYEIGFEQLGVAEEDLDKIIQLMHRLSLTRLESLRPSQYPEKGVTNDHGRHLRGAIFAFGSEDYNGEWREHAASSIREMVSIFSNNDSAFIETLKKSYGESRLTEEIRQKIELTCSRIKKYYQFFTGVTHHQQAAITNGFRQLENPTCGNEDCLTGDSFKIVFRHFFVDMRKIIEELPNL